MFHREWVGDTRCGRLKSYTCVKFTVSIPGAMSFHSAPILECWNTQNRTNKEQSKVLA